MAAMVVHILFLAHQLLTVAVVVDLMVTPVLVLVAQEERVAVVTEAQDLRLVKMEPLT
jgi:hypothetical protein